MAPLAGNPGDAGSADGIGGAATFTAPHGLVYDGRGSLYVADWCAVRRIVVATGAVTTLAGEVSTCGTADGTGSTARFGGDGNFNNPGIFGLSIDGAGHLYVADASPTLREVTVQTGAVTTVAGTPDLLGATDGVGAAARFNEPTGLAMGGDGGVFILDTGSSSVRTFHPASALVATVAGKPQAVATGADGIGTAANLSGPQGLVGDGAGNVYIVDSAANTLRQLELTTGAVTTLAGAFGQPGSEDGMGAAARFNTPSFVASDGVGNLYITDTENSTVRKLVVSTGEVSTFAGTAGQTEVNGNGDGIGVAARFAFPTGIVSDGTGHLFVADTENATIRQIDLATATVTTLAGSPGAPGHADGVGGAASFGYPQGLAYADGAVYVTDDFVAIRRVDVASATVTTIAGPTPVAEARTESAARRASTSPSAWPPMVLATSTSPTRPITAPSRWEAPPFGRLTCPMTK